ncbi:VanZ family protein [Streptomyces sp. NBRC 109706]|uniref:VanZ family protein n=1 Tax=Streptomyces sp. NBRC 109706 TaxID=1550035 RepID=UPI00131D295E|nr:VanZ family protein [Streptomyces sp. NBRC 109706]
MRQHPAGSAEPTPPAERGPAEPPGSARDRRGSVPEVSPALRVGALVSLLVYLALATWLAMRSLTVLWVSPGNLEPLATIRTDIERGPVEAARTLGAGLVRLAPLGALLPLLGAHLGGGRLGSLARTAFTGAMVSLTLECGQTLAPSRVFDIDSVLLNTLGVALAHQLCYGLLRRFATTGPPPQPPPSASPPEPPARPPAHASPPEPGHEPPAPRTPHVRPSPRIPPAPPAPPTPPVQARMASWY